MQIFKTFFKIANKYKGTTIVYFSVFLVLVVLMGKIAETNGNDQFTAASVKFAVIDSDNSKASNALIDYVSNKHKLVELPDYEDETLQDNLYYKNISYIIYIPEDYEKRLMAGDTDKLISHTMKTDSAAGYFFNQDINAYLDTLQLYVAGGYNLEEALVKADTTATEAVNSPVTTISFNKNESKLDESLYYFFKYYAYAILSVLLMGLSPILITFHKDTLKARIDCSSLPKRMQNISLMLSGVIYAIGLWLLLMIFATIYYGPANMLSQEALMCVLNSFVYVIVMLVLAVLVGAFNLGANGLNLVANCIGLGSSFLCGIFVPLWVLSDKAVAVGKFFPAYWYVTSTDMISGINGDALSMTKYWTNIGIMLLFAVAILTVYFAISIQRRKSSIK